MEVINECALWCTDQIAIAQFNQLSHIWVVGIVLAFLIVYSSLQKLNYSWLHSKSINETQYSKAVAIIAKIKDYLLSVSIYSIAGFLIYHIFWVI